MSQDNKFFEDFMKLAGSAMGTAVNSANDAKKYFEDAINDRIDSFLANHNFVTREEFDVVKEMAAKALEENKKLTAKIKKLEKK